jgi:hypothetical protein
MNDSCRKVGKYGEVTILLHSRYTFFTAQEDIMKKIMITLMFAATMFMPYKTYSMFGSGANSSKALLSGVLVGVGSGFAATEFERRQERFLSKNEVIASSIIVPSLMCGFLNKDLNSTLCAFFTACGMYYSMETSIHKTITDRIEAFKKSINVEKLANEGLSFTQEQLNARNNLLRQIAALIDRQNIRAGSSKKVFELINALEMESLNAEPLGQQPARGQNQPNGLVGKTRDMKIAAGDFAQAAHDYGERVEAERSEYEQKNPGAWGKFKMFFKDATDDWKN